MEDRLTVSWESRLRDWALAAIEQVSFDRSIPLSTHVDQIVETRAEYSISIEDALRLMEWLVDYLENESDLRPRLLFPLHESSRLATTLPSLKRLSSLVDEFEPPSLYLVRSNFNDIDSAWETYRRPYPDEDGIDFGLREDLIVSYYTARSPHDVRSGGPYVRAVVVDVRNLANS